MARFMFLGSLLFFMVIGAQAKDAAQKKHPVPAARAFSPAEIKELRSAARPLLELKKRQAAAISQLMRAQAAERKQARSLATGAHHTGKEKISSDLRKRQQAAVRELRKSHKSEISSFIESNPGAEKAYKELLYSGVPVREPGLGAEPQLDKKKAEN